MRLLNTNITVHTDTAHSYNANLSYLRPYFDLNWSSPAKCSKNDGKTAYFPPAVLFTHHIVGKTFKKPVSEHVLVYCHVKCIWLE